MSESIDQLQMDDFISVDWQSVPARALSLECSAFSKAYLDLAREREAEGDLKGRDVHVLLWKCTSMLLNPSDPNEPFEAAWNGRSPNLEGISSSDVKVLSQVASLVEDPELRARISDICWTKERIYNAALLAIDSYVESAERLDALNQWLDARDRFERALRLSAMLGRGSRGRFDFVVGALESKIASNDLYSRRRDLQPARLMELLIEFRVGDFARWATFAESLATKFEQFRSWELAQDYLERKADLERLQKNHAAHHAAKVRAANLFVEIANEYLRRESPDHLSASMQLSRALEAMRQLGETARAEEIHRDMLEQQMLSSNQFQSFSQEMDIAAFVERSMEAVRDKGFIEAILVLVQLCNPPKLAELRETAERISEDFVFRSLFVTQRVDWLGRVVASKPSSRLGDDAAIELAIRTEMYEHAGRLHEAYVAAMIEPARYQIELQHRSRFEDFTSLVLNNPLVPLGRELIIARGLHAGLTGDFLVACHLLIPQMEHSIRHVLNRRGVITSTFDSEGIQEEMDLGRTFDKPELIEAFGEDLLFDLRGLLVERFGANLRNLMAHGLLNHGHFYSSQAIYFWWLSLRYFSLPILVADQRSLAQDEQEKLDEADCSVS